VSFVQSRYLKPLTPRAAGLAGCALAAALFAAGMALSASGCGRGEGPRVQVVNASGRRIDALWVRSEHDSVRVPPLAPGESVEVRPRVSGEDLLWITGTFMGRRIESHGGDYVEATGGYRFRATIDSAGQAELKFIRLGLW
jgi:hypothetical protein